MDDCVQLAVLRLLTRNADLAAVASRERWLVRVAARLLRAAARGGHPQLGPPRACQAGEAGFRDVLAAAEASDPARRALARDLFEALPGLLGRLPQPYGHVLYMQRLLGNSRAEIARRLCAWGSIRPSSCQRIFRRAHEMERLLLEGGSPRARWPKSYDPQENLWCLLPLPPFEALLE